MKRVLIIVFGIAAVIVLTLIIIRVTSFNKAGQPYDNNTVLVSTTENSSSETVNAAENDNESVIDPIPETVWDEQITDEELLDSDDLSPVVDDYVVELQEDESFEIH